MDFSIIMCYFIGALFAYFGIASFVKTVHDMRVCKTEIVARIVEYEIKRDSGGKHGSPHNHYFPIFFFHAEGRDIRKVGNIGYDSQVYPLGSDMKILYESGNPENFIMPGDHKSSLGVPVVSALMGLGVIAVTVLRHMGIIAI